MKTLKFKCTLLTDVILNMKAATTGPNETLDFIPGSNFLGIAAATLYGDDRISPETKSVLFHSGEVRFGDAHPSRNGARGLKAPASMFYPKLSGPEEELYIHHLIPSEKDLSGIQLKQCRRGFYDFSGNDNIGRLIPTTTSFALKSAYDRRERRSKDEQLFGYQSLGKGLTMYFTVEFDDRAAEFMEKVRKALVGDRRIGRSRSAQYGLVNIEYVGDNGFIEIDGGQPFTEKKEKYAAVYADSRLIFLDEYGIPTFRPTAGQLGLAGEVDWGKSQIRSFRYAPWNFKRQCFDTDRCGLEKGSVLVVRLPKDDNAIDFSSRYVGSYRNEGFGRVIYNPPFLKADNEGKALYALAADPKDKNKDTCRKDDKSNVSTPLIAYLKGRKKDAEAYESAIRIVNEWTEKNARLFKKVDFASQWGTVRSIATSAESLEKLKEDLFGVDGKDPNGYLMHGIAKDKWKGQRLEALRDFMNKVQADKLLSDEMARLAIVNLASEMGKK
ncbi:MAG: hypothetical protein K2M83_14055 [Muribaculaceae bacterium]|nr:hypothetical protein [Muribaculaceae bacterium]